MSGDRRNQPSARLVTATFAGLFAVPFVVAIVALAHPRWFPVLDLAQTEMRLRDVGTAHPPLIGLPGRIGTFAHIGSHPGPISFWAMWPVYELFGATSWAAHVAVVTLNVVAVWAMLWMAKRRGGLSAVLGLAVVVAILLRFYGPSTLSQPWNPYMPLVWWPVFVLALWSVLCGDRPMAVIAVFSGTFLLQTHISYLGLVLGLSGVAAASETLRSVLRRRRRRSAPPSVETPPVGRRMHWWIIAAALGILLWLPPVIDQFTSSPGNFTIIWRHFSNPPETPIGLRQGIELILVHLNPWKLLARQDRTVASVAPGLVFLAVWVTSVAAAFRMRHRPLLQLDLLLAAAVVLGIASAARIFGYVWYYLVLWAWGTAAIMALAIGWTAALVISPRWPRAERRGAVANVALACIAVLVLASFTFDMAHVDNPAPSESANLGRVVAPTIEALDAGTAPGGGRTGRYVVTWSDPIDIGAQGYGLLLELERKGFDVGAPQVFGAIVTPHRVTDPADATGLIHLSVGKDIDTWAAKPGVVRVAYVDPRTPAERAEYDRLHDQVITGLGALGLTDLVPRVDDNVFIATYEPRIPTALQDRLKRMLSIGLPLAVYIGPPGAGG